LDLKVEVRRNCELENIPCLQYNRNFCLIMVFEKEDVDVQKAASIVARLQPVNTSGIRDLCFQNSSYSYENICKLIESLKDAQVSISGSLKVWSSNFLGDEKVLDVIKIALENGLGGFLFYRSLDHDAEMPNLLIDQAQILKKLSLKIQDLKNMRDTSMRAVEAKKVYRQMLCIGSIKVKKNIGSDVRYGRIEARDGYLVMSDLHELTPDDATIILE
ncbi:unnamed protein product, partial [Meganyctiphanes norvegica]